MGIISLSANSRARLNAIGLASPGGGGGLVLESTIMGLSPGAYWKLDEASGTFADSSGGGLTGTGTNATHQGEPGGDGLDYVDLNGATNTRIQMADSSVCSIASGLSVFCLVKPDTLGDSWAMMSKGINPGYTTCEWAYAVYANGRISFDSFQPSGNGVKSRVASAGSIVTGSWQALVATCSSNATSATINIYKNNNTALGGTNTTGANTSNNLGGVFTLGNRIDIPNYEFDGGMAHAAIFNSVLSGTDIQDLMDAAAADGWI